MAAPGSQSRLRGWRIGVATVTLLPVAAATMRGTYGTLDLFESTTNVLSAFATALIVIGAVMALWNAASDRRATLGPAFLLLFFGGVLLLVGAEQRDSQDLFTGLWAVVLGLVSLAADGHAWSPTPTPRRRR